AARRPVPQPAERCCRRARAQGRGVTQDAVVIIGGGAVGSAAAYFLTREPGFAGPVVVIERDPTYQQASSALSASSIRQQFSTPINIALSRFGFQFLKTLDAVGLIERGYLFLASDAGMAGLAANHAV